jgi:hypothetical protein
VPDAKLYMGGLGKDLPLLQEYVRLHGRGPWNLGYISENMLNTWYNKVQCVVLPSVFEGSD